MGTVYDAEILSIRPDARGLTYDEACAQAKAALCALDPSWCDATCEEVVAQVANNCTLFVNSPIRLALTGSIQCPTPSESLECKQARQIMGAMDWSWAGASCAQLAAHIAQDCTIFVNHPIRLALTGTMQCPAPGAGNNNMLVIGLVGLGVVGAVAAVIASKSTKKVLVARVR